MEAHYKIFNELYDHMVNISVWVMLEKKKKIVIWQIFFLFSSLCTPQWIWSFKHLRSIKIMCGWSDNLRSNIYFSGK